MVNERITNEDSIRFVTDKTEVASFEDNGNGMEGYISEGDHVQLSAGDMCALAVWLLTKAEERANRLQDEIDCGPVKNITREIR